MFNYSFKLKTNSMEIRYIVWMTDRRMHTYLMNLTKTLSSKLDRDFRHSLFDRIERIVLLDEYYFCGQKSVIINCVLLPCYSSHRQSSGPHQGLQFHFILYIIYHVKSRRLAERVPDGIFHIYMSCLPVP